jgi:hypothetical protein
VSHQLRRVTLPLGFGDGDYAPQPGKPKNPVARVNFMAENADVADGLALQLEQEMKFLGTPFQAEMSHSERIGAPAEQTLLFRRRQRIDLPNL